ncbi:DUF7000 family protein [Vagococcus sp.]|uniref:DUF7000 family protein n=1 Tax=Vagococcus sp. TaxID=1933889 RepID=UPI002FCBF925
MSKELQERMATYQEVVYEGSSVVTTYFELIHFIRKLRADFSKQTKEYKVGNVSEGYMDYTYFAFFTPSLRADKLRFGIVLNHFERRFELWLMAQNEEEKVKYWEKLKQTPWNKTKQEAPRYSVLEAVIVEKADFTDLDILSKQVIEAALVEVEKIKPYL